MGRVLRSPCDLFGPNDTERSVKPNDQESQHAPSQLFSIRLWIEEIGENHIEIRGKVSHVLSREYLVFRDWTELVGFLTARTVTEIDPTSSDDDATS